MQEVFASLERGAVLLTATRRLARVSKLDYTSWQRDRARTVWSSPSILPLDAYVKLLWNDWLATGANTFDLVLLTAQQEALVWEQIIRDSPEGDSLLQIDATARQAMDAWRLIHGWRLPIDDRFSATEDCAAFLGWAREFERHCSRNNWTDTARLPDFVLGLLRTGVVAAPGAAWFAGFDELSPQQREFLDRLGATARQPPLQRTVTHTRACTTAEDELRCAASWARSVLEGNPAAKIGVVVLDLARLRSKVDRIFQDELQSSAAFHISLGRPLTDYPMIHTALLALEFAAVPLPLTKAGLLLRSPFLGGATQERAERAALDARLRRFAGWSVSVEDVRDATRPDCHELRTLLRALADAPTSKARTHTVWSRTFSDLLRSIGWPGDRKLDSREHQLMNAWTEMLSQFASLDAVSAPLEMSRAVDRLHNMAAGTIFQFEDTGAPVQISDDTETAGVQFDHLWILGLHDEALPEAAQPNPFIPVPLQREYDVPRASAEQQYRSARTIFERLISSAPDVVLSFPQVEGDRMLAPSPFLTAPPHPITAQPSAWTTAIRASAALETLVDETGPPHIDEGVQRGGVYVLRDMAACPFRAFAAWRLGAKELDAIEPGLSPRDKGTAVHAVLQRIWSELGSQDALRALSHADRTALIERHVGAVLSDRFAESTNRSAEQIRLERLIGDWLDLERTRAPFAVAKLEEKKIIELGGLHLEIRGDRIDELPEGRHIILDYKTGEVKTKAWTGDRPDEPQIPLYCISSDTPIAGAAFAQIRAEGVCFAGIPDTPLPGVPSSGPKTGPPLNAQIDEWRRGLTTLVDQFRAGDARVDPKYGAKTCEYCAIVPLCRIREIDHE